MRLIFATQSKPKSRNSGYRIPPCIQSLAELDYNTPIIESDTIWRRMPWWKRKLSTTNSNAPVSQGTGLEIAALHGAPGVHSARDMPGRTYG